MKTLLYIGYIGRGSYGDDVAYSRLNAFIARNYRDKINLKLMSKDASDINITGAGDYDFCLIGGGTCISNLYRPFADRIALTLQQLGLRYGFLGTGVYFEKQRNQAGMKCIDNNEAKKRTKNFIDGAEFISVRDEGSANFLRSYSKRKDIEVCYDPGLYSPPTLITERVIEDHRPLVGLNFCWGNNQNCLGAMNYDWKKLSNIIMKFVADNINYYRFVHIPFNSVDTKLNNRFVSLGVQCMPFNPPAHIAAWVNKCDYFIGNRVHADVTAASFEIPFLSICYTEPNRQFLDHIGWTNFVTPEELISKKVFLNDIFEPLTDNQYRLSLEKQLHQVVITSKQKYEAEAHRLCQSIMNS